MADHYCEGRLKPMFKPFGNEETCPSCAAHVARVDDVEGMAKFLANTLSNNWAMGGVEQDYWRHKARALSAWLKEGK